MCQNVVVFFVAADLGFVAGDRAFLTLLHVLVQLSDLPRFQRPAVANVYGMHSYAKIIKARYT